MAAASRLRVLFLNTDYPNFLSTLYAGKPGAQRLGYGEQMRLRNDTLFGTADFMSRGMMAAGHEAIDIHANNRYLQRAWLTEHPLRWHTLRRVLHELGGAPWSLRSPTFLHVRSPMYYDALGAQIRAFQPNVIYNHDPNGIAADRLRALLPAGAALVAQIASPVEPTTRWADYDLIISSLPNFVRDFKAQGLNAVYQPLCFEPRILERVPAGDRTIPVSFVGSISLVHTERAAYLETLAVEEERLQIWGDGITKLPPGSPIHTRHRGSAWGTEMFGLLGASRITLNKHINIAGSFANNMRLFEATGMGALLLTDWKENLCELFEVGREVVAFRSTEECADLIAYYLEHDGERARIAAAGQARCLRDHTYERRAIELAAILENLLR